MGITHHRSALRALALTAAGATALAGLGTVGSATADQDRGKGHGQHASVPPSSDYYTVKTPRSRGFGGAVTSVDPEASRVGIEVLKNGGNAVDAAVATAAALGVTEPYSAGLGGGGYFVSYDAKSGKVRTLDGRETAPATMPTDAFLDPATGEPYTFTPDLVTSGVSVGTPGTPATWETALRKWGSYSLRRALEPAAALAQRGFVVDETFRSQTADNQTRFEAYTTTPELFLPGGQPPAVGTVFKNPDLARTYRTIGREGTKKAFYRGPLAQQIADLVQDPPTSPDTTFPVPAGYLTTRDLKKYRVIEQKPTHSDYRGYDVYGMAPSSSGGTTVGESLDIMEQLPPTSSTATVLHHYLEATALAFADRAKYVGDPRFVDVPTKGLLSDTYAAERACEVSETQAMPKPTTPGDVTDDDGRCDGPAAAKQEASETENVETTNLTVTDKHGNVVEYTLTIEQTGGSGILVPGRGFLLNNELTDFSTTYDPADPNRIQPGKRPRSSMSPTIILEDGKPFLALGSPGGATIITTVTQIVVNRIDRAMAIQDALADPRASQRNSASVSAEPEFIATYGPLLTPFGHTFTKTGDQFTSASEIGAATAIEFGPGGALTAVSEPQRRGGGSALVVSPR